MDRQFLKTEPPHEEISNKLESGDFGALAFQVQLSGLFESPRLELQNLMIWAEQPVGTIKPDNPLPHSARF